MSEVLEKSVKEKAVKETVKRKKQVIKRHRLDELFGLLKGKIFYDDAIFNLGVKA